MNERENFTASEEARRDVLSRAGHAPASGDPVGRMVDAAFYRETHRAEPTSEPSDGGDDDVAGP